MKSKLCFRLVLRIKYDDVTARYVLGKKYGANHKTEVEPLLNLAWSLGLNVVGVSFHIGSSMKNFFLFTEAIEVAREVFSIGSRIGFEFDLLDIGGGISGNKNFLLEKVITIYITLKITRKLGSKIFLRRTITK